MSDGQAKIAPNTGRFFSEPDLETVQAENADMVLEAEVKELLSGNLGWATVISRLKQHTYLNSH